MQFSHAKDFFFSSLTSHFLFPQRPGARKPKLSRGRSTPVFLPCQALVSGQSDCSVAFPGFSLECHPPIFSNCWRTRPRRAVAAFT